MNALRLADRIYVFFVFNDTATTEIYTLSLHDALPIYEVTGGRGPAPGLPGRPVPLHPHADPHGRPRPWRAGHRRPVPPGDRKSTRLNSSHAHLSSAVFCLK